MKIRMVHFVALNFTLVSLGLSCAMAAEQGEIPPPKEEPRVIDPGPPPSDAIVLFDGKDLSQWQSDKNGGPAKWEVQDGVATVNGTGSIATRQGFGDCQLHIEWAAPAEVKGNGQGRGNSGVYMQGRYEVQLLDSYNNKTYYHGQAGAIYNQYAPLVNASRRPGEWQSYDIIFKAPKFDEQGKVIERARITVLHNGVLIQNNVEIYGNTYHDRPALYIAHGPKASLKLQ